MSLGFTGERIVPGAVDCEPTFAQKMYQEHVARYAFAAQLAQGADVLDIGCGVGYGSQWLAKAGANSVLGFDVSAEAIEHARMNYFHPAVTYSVQDATEINLESRYDLVTCFELIEHIAEQEKVLDLVKATLSEEGVLAISTPRPLDDIRTHFHVHEMSFEELYGLLKARFRYVEAFFEVNCFTSFVGRERPSTINEIVSITDRVDIDHADYFVFLASDAPINDRKNVQPLLTLNDDSYVLTLENDVGVLRRAENDQKARIVDLEREKSDLAKAYDEASKRASAVSEISDQAQSLRVTVDQINNQVVSQLAQLTEAQSLREQIGKFQTELTARNAYATELNGQIESLNAELRVHHSRADALTQTIEQRDQQILKLEASFASKSDELRQALAETQDQIKEFEAKFETDRENANDEKAALLLETDELRRVLAEVQHRLAENESNFFTEISRAEAKNTALEQTVEQLQSELAGLLENLESVQRALAATSEQLAASQTETHNLRGAADRLPDALERASALENELNAVRYRLDYAESTLARFRSSFSWSVTRPLRWIWRNYRKLTGRSLP